MKTVLQSCRRLAAALLLLLAVLPGTAQPLQRQENRFLFLVDTSSAMRGYSNAVVQTVEELLASDMRGELREGDTIGLWTYNEKLNADFPMQVWSKAGKNSIVDNTAGFLLRQRYEKFAHLDRVMPSLKQVIKNSERVTIALVFDGRGAIEGTPFDKELAALQKEYGRKLRSAHVPFVIVLAARNGTVFDYTINYPGIVAIPHTANPEPVPETNAPAVAVLPVSVTNAPAPVVRPVRSIVISRLTNAASAHVPGQAVVSAPIPPIATPLPPAKPASVPPAPPVVQAPVPAPVAPVPQAIVPAPSVPVVPPAKPAPVPAVAPVVAPAPVHAEPAPPVAVVAQPRTSSITLLVVAFSLLVVAAVFVIFLWRRFRHPPEASLISQSIDHPR
jgi:hypothetical protein